MTTIILIIIIIILVFIDIKKQSDTSTILSEVESENYSNKYLKKDFLLTVTELKFYKLLKTITDELNLVICPQVPLYEIVRNKNFKDFNKIQSKSIDFVITDPNLKIRMCIELDDYSHHQVRRIKRDIFIEKLFKDLDLKLIRIPVQNFYNVDDLRCKIKESL